MTWPEFTVPVSLPLPHLSSVLALVTGAMASTPLCFLLAFSFSLSAIPFGQTVDSSLGQGLRTTAPLNCFLVSPRLFFPSRHLPFISVPTCPSYATCLVGTTACDSLTKFCFPNRTWSTYLQTLPCGSPCQVSWPAEKHSWWVLVDWFKPLESDTRPVYLDTTKYSVILEKGFLVIIILIPCAQ